uniref:Uncharacterized protein n=1 Tax=Caenorhabditis tropicalis TaxID=1561998 RepID=A0A1I7V517_9PELO
MEEPIKDSFTLFPFYPLFTVNPDFLDHFVNDDQGLRWIIYISLIAFILLLIIANCAIFCCYRRPIQSKYIGDKDSELFRIDSSREENSNSIIYSTIV